MDEGRGQHGPDDKNIRSLMQHSITVVTATLNAARDLPRLIKSLESQTDKDFSWAIFDGGSTDATVEIIRKSTLGRIQLTVGRDFGIYDALNQCIQKVDADYYLVCGADDELFPTAIADYRDCVSQAAAPLDFVAAPVERNNQVHQPKRRRGFVIHSGLGGGVAVSHAVGLLIRTGLHQKFGIYSRRFPIAADQLFFELALKGKATIAYASRAVGRYCTEGLSGQDGLGTVLEQYRIQIMVGRNPLVETLLMFARVMKHFAVRHG